MDRREISPLREPTDSQERIRKKRRRIASVEMTRLDWRSEGNQELRLGSSVSDQEYR
jgi:hypothetical protein